MKKGKITISDTHLISEWNFKKNKVAPSNISYGSGKKNMVDMS